MNLHWRLEHDREDFAWLHFDHGESSVNVLSLEALEGFDAQLRELEATPPKGLVLLSDKPGGFIAGADVNNFRNSVERREVEGHIRQVQRQFDRVEALPCPTLALIHGFCLGGGLELALCCDYRLARDDEATRFSFPEVRLGIFPGYGGTLRSIRCIGALAAMELMLSGRSIDSRQALKLGLVDRLAPQRQLLENAREMLRNPPSGHRPSSLKQLANLRPIRRLLAPLLLRQTARHIRQEHYPAPYALINHWKSHGSTPQEMLEGEAREVSRLFSGGTARNLIRDFFLRERLKSLAVEETLPPRHLHVVGSGSMGGDIAAWCALRGMHVSLQDREAEALGQAVARAHRLFQDKLRTPRLVNAAMDRLTPDLRGNGAIQADLVIETIFEDLEAKRRLFQNLEPRLKPEALMATNTSSIPLEEIAEGLVSPQRLIGLHFFNPVTKMPLVEVVRGTHSDPACVARGIAFVHHIGRLPLPVRSHPGFLINRILMPYLLEAFYLLDEGVPAESIDQAALEFGMPMGPLELADTVGLDICLAVARRLAPLFDLILPPQLEHRVAERRLGKKSGSGFYRYRKGVIQRDKPDKGYQPPADLGERMLFRLLNESVACLREGVVADADLLDAGVIFGTGFAPFLGGPIHTILSGGVDLQRKRLEQLERQYGRRFHPDTGWTRLGQT